MLARDVLRFQFALDSASVMPLGSGALAGVNWEIDRDAVAADLGFEHVSHNSIDGASNRDFVLDYLAAASTCAMHLSRLGSEIVIWSSTEFGFCELDESFSSGSSIMPQKVNPDSAELLRAKSPRVAADYATLLGRHARAAADLRQGHAGGQGAALRRDRHDRALPRRDRGDAGWDRVRPRADGGGLRRRDAGRDRGRRPAGPQGRALPRGARHRRRAGPRRDRAGQARSPSSPPRSCARRSEHLDDSYYEVLRRGSWLESKRIAGGTGSVPLAAQIERGPRRRSPRSRPGSSTSALERRPRVRSRPRPASARAFFDRSVHDVARDLIGCRLFFDGVRRHDRRDRELRARRSRLPRLRRPHRPHRGAVRAAGARLRLPLLRHPQPAQLRLPNPRARRRRC